VPVTKTGVRQVTDTVYDLQQKERQVARRVLVSDDSGDGINSGAFTQELDLNSFGDSDQDDDLADNIGYIKAAKIGPEAGAKFGYQGPQAGHPSWHGLEISSEDDATYDAGDATSDVLIISADSSADERIVYDTVLDTIRVPRQVTRDVPFSYIDYETRQGTRQVPYTYQEQVE
jgi:hypothetical protein